MKVDKNRVYELHGAGFSVDEVAEKCGCSKNYAQSLIQRKYGKVGKVDTGKIRALWKAGWTINSIMKDMNISEDEVRKVVLG